MWFRSRALRKRNDWGELGKFGGLETCDLVGIKQVAKQAAQEGLDPARQAGGLVMNNHWTCHAPLTKRVDLADRFR